MSPRRAPLLVTALIAIARPTLAADPHALQEFAAKGDTGEFSAGGSMSLSNPGAGGVGGASDGFLLMENAPGGFFAAYTAAAPFIGDYTASGIGGITFWLRDAGAPQDMQMHLGLGPGFSNFYQFNAAFHPTTAWTRFYVKLSSLNPAQWTQTHGTSGTLAEALAQVNQVLLRHDLPPYEFFPDSISGEIGLDRVELHPVCPADTNGDDVVNFSDLNNVLSNYGLSGLNLPGDVNNSGTVDFADLNSVLSAFGTAC